MGNQLRLVIIRTRQVKGYLFTQDSAIFSSTSLTLTVSHWIPNESLWTLALEASHVIAAERISAAWRPTALVVVRAALGPGVSGETWRAVATITAIQVCAERSGPAGLRIEKAFVEVHTPIVWIALEALLAQARVVARRIQAMRVHPARAGNVAFVDVEAQLFAVALVARLTFA